VAVPGGIVGGVGRLLSAVGAYPLEGIEVPEQGGPVGGVGRPLAAVGADPLEGLEVPVLGGPVCGNSIRDACLVEYSLLLKLCRL
jgi:hypothetical protein